MVISCSLQFVHVKLGEKQLGYYGKRIVCEAALYTHV